MSLDLLLKNFGSKKEVTKPAPTPAPVVEQVKDDNAGFSMFDSLTDDSACGKCGNNFFWRHKNWWFCGYCRKPPAAEFIHDVRNGEFLIRRPKISQAKITDRQQEKTVEHVETYDSVIVVEGDGACPECPCRWVKETPRDDGTVQRTCYTCKAVIPDGRHGTIRTEVLPYYLLPFWKWFNDRKQLSD